MTLADVPGLATAGELQLTVDAIAEWQLPSGMVPWFRGWGGAPWQHVSAAMPRPLAHRPARPSAA